ncbi:MAG: lipoyl synthase [Xanthomonadales bacterium]|nr:lipoyl synthase [Xanthomonadales bacterium]
MNDKSGRSPIPITLADAPPQAVEALVKELGADKISRNTAKFERAEVLRKPDWIRVRLPLGNAVAKLKSRLRENSLVTVCEEASCPNIHECFSKGTATFMILGEVCTRRCSFCDVAHGRPLAVDTREPAQLAETIASMQLKYVVITSVDRDDLLDGGAQHYADCIREVRAASPDIKIEILVPDFRGKGRMQRALDILDQALPDVFNHNLETVAPLYPNVRPGADYQWSLELLKAFKQRHPKIPTKSGIMLGLGEDLAQVEALFQDLKDHQVDMITVGQYLQPTSHHHPVLRYWTPDEFAYLAELGNKIGFSHVASGPLVRSSYHADIQAEGVIGG